MQGKEDRLVEMKRFSQKLADSAYKKETRKEMFQSGIKRYYRLVLLDLAGGRKLYRSRDKMKDGRRMKLLHSRM